MQQGSLFLHAMAFGVALIFCYDLLRIFRRGVPHGTVWIAVEDMFFWLISAFVLFQLMYEKNDGKLRWFVIMGVLLGMILYNVSLSRAFWKFLFPSDFTCDPGSYHGHCEDITVSVEAFG